MYDILGIKASFCHCCTSVVISVRNLYNHTCSTQVYWPLVAAFQKCLQKNPGICCHSNLRAPFFFLFFFINEDIFLIYFSSWQFRLHTFHHTFYLCQYWCSGFLRETSLQPVLIWYPWHRHRVHLDALYLKAWRHSLALSVEKGSWAASHIQYGSSDLECYTRLLMSRDADPPIKWLMFIGSHLLYNLSRILLHLFSPSIETETLRSALANVWQKTIVKAYVSKRRRSHVKLYQSRPPQHVWASWANFVIHAVSLWPNCSLFKEHWSKVGLE